uniref:threonine ammonia-lyase n=1 Tax=Spiroplasma citri TaxID=2133 RepID=Q14M59_SPICI|nr:hypothetical threonine dehydratase n-terminal and c-terminal truncated transmembrane protein [Spiroplasma citri]
MMELKPEIIAKGVVAASAGNHSKRISFAANLLKVPATIVMTQKAPISKINATRNYGVEVILHGDFFDDANKKALEIAKAEYKFFVHAFNDIDVISGQVVAKVQLALKFLKNYKILIMFLFQLAGGGGFYPELPRILKQLIKSAN